MPLLNLTGVLPSDIVAPVIAPGTFFRPLRSPGREIWYKPSAGRLWAVSSTYHQ